MKLSTHGSGDVEMMTAQSVKTADERRTEGEILLRVNNLSVTFDTYEGNVHALDSVNLSLRRGETLGILGESGSGKSTLASAIISLTPENGHVKGTIEFEGKVIASDEMTGAATVKMKRKQLRMLSEKLRSLRWKGISIVFQGSMNAFNPVYTIERQIAEIYKLHTKLSDEEISRKVEQTVRTAGLNPVILKSYPHELSGGMKQRAVIAMALALNPTLVIADEPTTGLDVITQAKIISELKRLRLKDIDSMIVISHDVGVVSQLADKVAVLYAGKLMEYGSIEDIYLKSANPYTRALLDSYPSIAKARTVMRGIPGSPPNQLNVVQGCRFASRCLYRQDICIRQDPPFVQLSEGHMSLCHFAADFASGKIREPPIEEDQVITLRRSLTGSGETLLDIKKLTKFFHLRGTLFGTVFSREESKLIVRAVESVEADIRKGEIFAVVGESGSGKTTLGKTLLRLLEPTSGSMIYRLEIREDENGEAKRRYGATGGKKGDAHDLVNSSAPLRIVQLDVGAVDEKDSLFRSFRRDTQLIFQDPYDSLNPKMTVLDIVSEPVIAYKATRSPDEMVEMVKEALRTVRLNPPETFLERYPHELSGGERQRVAAARALVLKPKFLVADEPISMLDVSLRAGFMNLLLRLRNEEGITIFYITHDIASARYLADRILVLYLGVAVELGDSESITREPLHPYTKALIQAVPLPTPSWNPGNLEIYGEIGSAAFVHSGCRFVDRCPYMQATCRSNPPPRLEVGGRWYLCHFSQSDLATIKKQKKVLRDSALMLAESAVDNPLTQIISDDEKKERIEMASADLTALAASSNDDDLINTKMQELERILRQ